MLGRLLGIPEASRGIGELVEEGDVLVPADLCKRPLHNCRIRPCSGETPHVLEVSRRKPAHVGKRLAQVRRQAVDDLGTPALSLLAIKDDPAYLPIRRHHRGIGGQHRAQPRLSNALLDLG